jgi:hypothetical protein
MAKEPSMKRMLIGIATCVAVVALCWPCQSPAEEEQGKVSKIMADKLKCSKNLLEGIALKDFTKITRNAEELIQLSKTEEWLVLKTPKYELHNNEFRRTAENIIAKAKAKNIDGVTLAYFEMTMSCVRCHEYVREVRDARLPNAIPGPTVASR